MNVVVQVCLFVIDCRLGIGEGQGRKGLGRVGLGRIGRKGLGRIGDRSIMPRLV